jgi:hypothetical protein
MGVAEDEEGADSLRDTREIFTITKRAMIMISMMMRNFFMKPV